MAIAEKPQFQHVTIDIFPVGHSLESCALDDPRASTFYVNRDGSRTSAERIIGDTYGVEVRSKKRMTGACRELFHSTAISVKPGAKPEPSANTLLIARAFELAVEV